MKLLMILLGRSRPSLAVAPGRDVLLLEMSTVMGPSGLESRHPLQQKGVSGVLT